jgi:hypothetical protein
MITKVFLIGVVSHPTIDLSPRIWLQRLKSLAQARAAQRRSYVATDMLEIAGDAATGAIVGRVIEPAHVGYD